MKLLKRKWDVILNIQEESIEVVENRNTLGFSPSHSRPEAGFVLFDLSNIIIPEGYRMFVDQVCQVYYSGGSLVSTTSVSGNSEDKQVYVICQDSSGNRVNLFSQVYIKVRFLKAV